MMEEFRLSNAKLPIAVPDIGDFKQLNDVYGHAAGDWALLRFASVLRKIVHDRIYAFRVGGEEFVLLFQGYSGDEADKVCKEALSVTKAAALPELGGGAMTFGGVAEMHAGETEPLELFKASDAALYSAKRSGKGRLMARDSSMP